MDADDARIARRLAVRAGAQLWIGLCVKAVPAGQHPEGDAIVLTPDHYLAAAWPPPARGPMRWPEAVVIGSPSASRALAELFRHLPPDATLHLAGLEDVDAELAARILLAADRNLEPYQREAIEAFAQAQRERTQASIAERYTDRDARFERFRARVLHGTDRTSGR